MKMGNPFCRERKGPKERVEIENKNGRGSDLCGGEQRARDRGVFFNGFVMCSGLGVVSGVWSEEPF